MSWQLIYDFNAYTIQVTSGNFIFAGSINSGIIKSTDYGQSFSNVNSGIIATSIRALAAGNNKIYAGTMTGLYYTTNAGAAWVKSSLDIAINSLANLSDKKILAGTSEGLYISSNGKNWNRIDYTPSNHGVNDMAVSDKYIYAVMNEGSSLYKSKLNARNWSSANLSAMYIYAVAVNRSNGYVYAGFELNGAVRSTNNGVTWTNMSIPFTGDEHTVFELEVNSSGDIFAGTIEGMFRSTDNGNTWLLLSLPYSSVFSMAFNETGYVFAGTSTGVYYSSDNGDTWTQINTGITQLYVGSILAAPDGYVYAGTGGGGVFRTTSTLTKPNLAENKLIPTEYILNQNYPNPFNPATVISFSIPEQQLVTLKIYNIMGEKAAVLLNETKEPGTYNVIFNAGKLTSGVYFYTLNAGNFSQTKKLLLIK